MEPRPWTARDAALLGLTIVAWGTNYLFVRVGLSSAGPLWLAALRASAGAGALGAYFLFARPPSRLTPRERGLALLVGIPNTAGLLGFWFVAAASVPPGQTAVVIYTYPLWVALLSVPLLSLRLGVGHWAAIVGGFAGVTLVSQPWAGGHAAIPTLALGELIAAAVCWSVATVLVQRLFRREALPAANGYQMLAGAGVLLLLAVVFEGSALPRFTPSLTVAVLWMGVYGTAFAYAVWFFLLGKVPAPTLSAYAFLVPIVALGASAVFLGERLDAEQAIGVVLVLLSIYGISRASARPRPSGSPPGAPAIRSD